MSAWGSINRDSLVVFQVRPDSTVSPEGMIGFDELDLVKQRLVSLDDRFGFGSFHSSYSFFLTQWLSRR